MTDVWWRLTIRCHLGQADAISAALIAATGNGIEEPAVGTVCTTVDSETDARRLLRDLTTAFGNLRGEIAATEAIDWSTHWRDGIVTRTFGRLVLTPSWLPIQPSEEHVVVSIDPESAFGSGEHGSTRGALTLLERLLHPGDRILDLGSGSGILAIAGVKLGARSAIGIEVDGESLPVAENNARKNGVAHAVAFLGGDAGDLAALAGPADLICSNILRSVNTALMPSILSAMAPAGLVIFAGMEEAEESLYLPVLALHGLEPVADVRDAGWWSVAARRR